MASLAPPENAEGIPDDDIILVEAGDTWLGGDYPSEGPMTALFVPAFRMDRVAVSNARYAAFMEADGYKKKELWSAEGWHWLEEAQVDRPAYWEDDRFNEPGQPVTGVSWFEGEAFARYVGGRLPWEVEWEKAARHKDKRNFPWGDSEPDAEHAHFAPDFVPAASSTMPVEALPKGDSPLGFRQMSGNLFEWCADPCHAQAPQWRESGRLTPTLPSSRRVLKGGAWTTGIHRLRISGRWCYLPVLRDNVVGLRVAYDVNA
jgi:formylglycine-generating enzyme required for sulfatase activity